MGMLPEQLNECKMYGIELDTISGETGISVKNLNRYLGYEEIQNLQNGFNGTQKKLNGKTIL